MTNERKRKFIKTLTGIIIPILVMVTSLAVVGVSYAWFTDKNEVKISTLELQINSVFVLTFEINSNPAKKYEGQSAYATNSGVTHLVTNDYATAANGMNLTADSNEYRKYMQDKAYEVGTKIMLDTDGMDVALNVSFDSVVISRASDNEVVTFSTANGTANKIPYGFTWYIEDAANNVYAPYGTVGGGNRLSSNGSSLTKWSTRPVKQDIEGFYSEKTDDIADSSFDFYIVFAPEELYWMQYSNNLDGATADWMQNFDYWYDSTESDLVKKMDGTRTYSDQLYTGATFTFTVTVCVTGVSEHAA